MTTRDEKIQYPICPINLYFEGDENECDPSLCDFDEHCCSEACKKVN